MTPMKLKTMGDVFEGLLVVRGSPTVTDTLIFVVTVASSGSVEVVDPVTLSKLLRVMRSAVTSVQRQL